jgi:serine/threonine protein kinase
MYDEKGYSEKVDIYAFGMALLEMVTGKYPYGECTNAAQIYKKVIQGIKPENFSLVTEPSVLSLIDACIGPESQRPTAFEILDHPFLNLEPEVTILQYDQKSKLTLQVSFKCADRMSVKFDFNGIFLFNIVETDTAEAVVNEMIQEEVLPAKYKTLITSEINHILQTPNHSHAADVEESKSEAAVSKSSNSSVCLKASPKTGDIEYEHFSTKG